MTDKIVVLSTCATAEDAERLARALVTEQLAACVSVVPRVRSFYRWKGELEIADEFLLVIKTSRDLFVSLAWGWKPLLGSRQSHTRRTGHIRLTSSNDLERLLPHGCERDRCAGPLFCSRRFRRPGLSSGGALIDTAPATK